MKIVEKIFSVKRKSNVVIKRYTRTTYVCEKDDIWISAEFPEKTITEKLRKMKN